MATKEPESVIARLMGLNKQPPHHQQPIRKQHRVLSDSYICKSASVGVRYGSSVSVRLSSTKYDEMSSGVKAVPGVQMSNYRHDFTFVKCSNSTSSEIQLGISCQKPDSASVSSGACPGDRKGFCEKGKPYTHRCDLRYLQKLELEKTDKLCSGISVLALKSGLCSKSDGREHNQSLRPKNGKVHYELAYRKRVTNNIVTPRRSFVVHNRTMNIISQQGIHRSNIEDVSGSGYMGEIYLKNEPDAFLLKKQDEFTRIYRLKNQKISEKDILEPRGGSGHENFQFSLGVNGSISQSSESSSSCFSCSDSEKYVRSIQDEISERCVGTELSQTDPGSQYATEDTLPNAEACNIDGSRIRADEDEQAKSDPVDLSMEDGHSSFPVHEALSGEASLKEFSGQESANWNFPTIGNSEFQDDLKITNQQSPDSVLKPFDSQNPSTFQCFRSMGLLLQVQDSDFESDDTPTEGSEMVVSDNEDSIEDFRDCSHSDKRIQRWFRDDKSRNFSYIVDVLDEAGFCSADSFIDSNTWNSMESPINPLVFKSLEKKYGKQTSWLKSARHLLFDRINLALLEIVNPIIKFQACETSLHKWFSAAWRRDKVEDELWMLLMNEEKEESRNLSEKALGGAGKWLELEEDIGVICREIETSLFDEVVMEFASLWN